MRFSPLSSFASVERLRHAGLSTEWVKALTWLARVVTGSVFAVSGMAKAIDPWGSVYKFTEYSDALGIGILPALLTAGVFVLCAAEFLTGVFLLLGCYRKAAPLMALAFMCVMLPLTLWVAIADPVSDCGCFGDFIIIGNWATFWKNVALTAMAVWLVRYNRGVIPLVRPAFQWLVFVAGLAGVVYVSLRGYIVQPIVDFRAYPVGGPLVDEASATDEGHYVFVYRRGNETKEVGEDDPLPDEADGWEFVESKAAQSRGSGNPGKKGRTFRIWSSDGLDDITSDLLGDSGETVILLVPDMSGVSPADSWTINRLFDRCRERGAMMFAVVSGNEEEIAQWRDLTMPSYPIYTADDTAIKEVARGNPAVVVLKDGIITDKYAL